jgi:hypothetical protein
MQELVLHRRGRPPARVPGVARLRPLEEESADRRRDPVCAEQHIGALLVAIREADGDAVVVLVEADAFDAQADGAVREVFRKRLLQHGAVDADARRAVPLGDARDRKPAHQFSVGGPVLDLLDDGTALFHGISHPDLLQRPHGVHPEGESGADFVQLRHPFVHGRLDTCIPEGDRRGKAPNARTDHDPAHGLRL